MGTKKAQESVVGHFMFERETKNKVRFKESDETEHIGTVYVSKATYEELGSPEDIDVEIRVKK